jgi:hypothetical protein
MSVQEMLCHTADQFRMMYGDIQTQNAGNFFTRQILKPLVLRMTETLPNLPTVLEINQKSGHGTKPTQFARDKDLLKNLLLSFPIRKDFDLVPHPKFGKLTKQEFGRLAYQHLDHHLKQFGV